MLDTLRDSKIQKIGFWTLWIFLCCYFMQLFNFPNVLTILIGSVFCLYFLIKQKKFRLDLPTVLLITSLASYYLILHGTRAFTMSLPYSGMVIYVLANYLGNEIYHSENREKNYILIILAAVAGYSLHGIINSLLFMDGQLRDGNIRVWMDIWEQWHLPGTWQVIFFLPVLSMVFPAIAYFKKRKWVNLIIFATSVLFVYIALASQTRTPILAFPIVFCVQAVMYMILEKEIIINLAKNKKMQIAAAIFLAVMVIALIILKNQPLIASFINILGRDGGIFNNIRFKLHKAGLQQLFEYPMGGYQMYFLGHPHAHNTWIDIADAAGIIPFFLFAAYTVHTIYELICWLLKKEISADRKIIVAGFYGIFFLYYTVERGLGGSMHYMTPWFLVNALVHSELVSMRNKTERN